ncbi:sulfite exporter TauE/SafE family protein [Mesobacterium pallidum]|uniref:sulfite exporter TauE/SafE family protein n=1 Tax=Mesobacterium pallidum TaxID=2872037 RepID=UPI001EE24FCB|nr:sulfite exporter TauE/SafE family protein [Mesobacterium pallidum]
MLALDWGFFAIAAPAVVFAGISKSGFGSGAAFAASSILALVLEPGQALGIMLPLLMVMDVTSLRPWWGKWHGPSALFLALGAIPGVALGAALYSVADADLFRLLIGGISIGFVAWQAGRGMGWIKGAGRALPDWAGGLAGMVAGFTSFVSHAGGPPAAVYLLSKQLTKGQYQATTVIVFWMVNIFKVVPYAFLGIFTWDTLRADLALAPFAVLGALLGVRLHHLVPERQFFLLTYVLLTCTGAKLIWDALT